MSSLEPLESLTKKKLRKPPIRKISSSGNVKPLKTWKDYEGDIISFGRKEEDNETEFTFVDKKMNHFDGPRKHSSSLYSIMSPQFIDN